MKIDNHDNSETWLREKETIHTEILTLPPRDAPKKKRKTVNSVGVSLSRSQLHTVGV